MEQDRIDSTFNPPEWWEDEVSLDHRKLWQKGLDHFLNFNHGTKIDHLTFGIDLCTRVIPFVAQEDKRWFDFPVEHFNVNDYEAHHRLYHATRNRFNALLKIHNDAKAQKAAKKKELEQKKYEEARKQTEELDKKEAAKKETQSNMKDQNR